MYVLIYKFNDKIVVVSSTYSTTQLENKSSVSRFSNSFSMHKLNTTLLDKIEIMNKT